MPCCQNVVAAATGRRGASCAATSCIQQIEWHATVDSSARSGENGRSLLEGYPSGQRGQTVNLLAYDFGGSNPPPSTILISGVANKEIVPRRAGVVEWENVSLASVRCGCDSDHPLH